VTVRADDIALRGLGQDACDASPTDQRWHTGDLRQWVAVIEIHRALGKSSATVGTGNAVVATWRRRTRSISLARLAA
jgi:hypothetical protein